MCALYLKSLIICQILLGSQRTHRQLWISSSIIHQTVSVDYKGKDTMEDQPIIQSYTTFSKVEHLFANEGLLLLNFMIFSLLCVFTVQYLMDYLFLENEKIQENNVGGSSCQH